MFLVVVERAQYQFIIWKFAPDINPDEPMPDNYVWKRGCDEYISFTCITTLPPAPRSPSAADKMWLQQVCMQNISV